MLKKISKLTGLEALSKKIQAEICGGKEIASGTFSCYSDGVYIGEKNTLQECWDACQ